MVPLVGMAPACQNQPTKVPPSACEGAPSKLLLGRDVHSVYCHRRISEAGKSACVTRNPRPGGAWTDWIRAKAQSETGSLRLRTKASGKEGAFTHDDYKDVILLLGHRHGPERAPGPDHSRPRSARGRWLHRAGPLAAERPAFLDPVIVLTARDPQYNRERTLKAGPVPSCKSLPITMN